MPSTRLAPRDSGLPVVDAARIGVDGVDAAIDELDDEHELFVAAGCPVPGLPVVRTVAAGGDDVVDAATSWVHALPRGAARGAFDESLQVALVHPEYDGFVVTSFTAHADVERLEVRPVGDLAGAVTTHHAAGGLARGCTRPVDVELHPGIVAAGGVIRGTIVAVDAARGDEPLAPPVEVVLATDAAIDCVLAGRVAGPLASADLDVLVGWLETGACSAPHAARCIERGILAPPAPSLRARIARIVRRGGAT